MNKADLVSSVQQANPELSRRQVQAVVDSLLDTIQDNLADGVEVKLTGFGQFSPVERAARTSRNPQTGEPVQIPAKREPKFKPGKPFKDRVNSKRG